MDIVEMNDIIITSDYFILEDITMAVISMGKNTIITKSRTVSKIKHLLPLRPRISSYSFLTGCLTFSMPVMMAIPKV